MPAWWDVTAYTLRDLVVFAALIQAGLQLLTVLVPYVCERTVAGRIAVKGKHLDVLDTTDVCFIVFNKLSTVVFIYHLLLVAARTDSIKWAAADATLANTLGSLVVFYPVYDLFYSLFHRALHHRAVYKCVCWQSPLAPRASLTPPPLTPPLPQVGPQAPPQTKGPEPRQRGRRQRAPV